MTLIGLVSRFHRTSTPVFVSLVLPWQDVFSSPTSISSSLIPGQVTSRSISENASSPFSGRLYLVVHAYEMLQVREPELMGDYRKYILVYESIESIAR